MGFGGLKDERHALVGHVAAGLETEVVAPLYTYNMHTVRALSRRWRLRAPASLTLLSIAGAEAACLRCCIVGGRGYLCGGG